MTIAQLTGILTLTEAAAVKNWIKGQVNRQKDLDDESTLDLDKLLADFVMWKRAQAIRNEHLESLIVKVRRTVQD